MNTINEPRHHILIPNISMFLLSFVIIAIEIIYCHILQITTNYLKANFIIAIAMLGISMGGLAAFVFSKLKRHYFFITVSFFLLCALILGYYNLGRMGLFHFPFLLILPFFFSSVMISFLFTRGNSNLLYCINLLGSACGLIFPIVMIPQIGSENCLILLLFIPILVMISGILFEKQIRQKMMIIIFSLLLTGGIGFLLANNLSIPRHISTVDFEKKILPSLTFKGDQKFLQRVFVPQEGGRLVLCASNRYDIQRARNLLVTAGYKKMIDLFYDVKPDASLVQYFKIFGTTLSRYYSEDNLIGRIDYLYDGTNIYLSVNGNILDQMDNRNGALLDPRVPHLSNPEIFIIGLSADGIVKSCRRIPGSRVSGIEINPVIFKTMNEATPLSFAANRPYSNVDVFEGEGRYFLASSKKKYDIITLMNMHPEQGAISTYCPENFHTREGLRLLLNKTTDRGFVLFEEIIIGKRNEFFFLKFMNTLKETLHEMGVSTPASNIIIYEWDFNPDGHVFRTVLVKKNKFTEDELTSMDEFLSSLSNTSYVFNLKMLHSPRVNLATSLATNINTRTDVLSMENIPQRLAPWIFTNSVFALANSPNDQKELMSYYSLGKKKMFYHLNYQGKNINSQSRIRSFLKKIGFPVEINLSPSSDDKPFPYDVYGHKSELTLLIKIVLLMALILFLPLLAILFFRYKPYRSILPATSLFVGLSGFAFMLIEIVLMQMYQRFVGISIFSMIAVLGSLLLFGGMGSLTSRYFNRKLLSITVCLIPLILLIMLFFLDDLFLVLRKYGMNQKIIFSILSMLPLSFFMGIPFPNALEIIKNQTTNGYAALFFGVSGAFSTVGSAAAIYFTVTFGFHLTLLLGIICYIFATFLFWNINGKEPVPKKDKSVGENLSPIPEP